ncbi:MAG: hypothetical protein PHP01_00885 [Phycisphaerae bacterium]|nr:hypothetical protein [Phycisphaerae bacterium]
MYEDKIETPDNNQKIWRYIDFSKYIDLLTTSELHFARADKFEDPYDCSWMQFFGKEYKQLSLANPQGKERTRQLNIFERLFVYLNCWHINEHQSAALWRLYSENKYETIAIQTTFGKFKSEIENKWSRDGGPHITKVKYDSENAGQPVGAHPEGRLFSCLSRANIIYKRPSFVHEQELRASIYQAFDKEIKNTILQNEAHLERLMKERPESIRIKINPSDLIEMVYISPLAKDWFVKLVKNVSGKLKDRVQKSNLYELY